jgi:hypothetical protein
VSLLRQKVGAAFAEMRGDTRDDLLALRVTRSPLVTSCRRLRIADKPIGDRRGQSTRES